ncbi:DUF2290 domain-containing protein [Erwinia billingiae]|uniref:DUF2290 domain-containing protein n=1 Tax=Erwinia billingiae TaxID=182337 RepID=UPI003207BE0B
MNANEVCASISNITSYLIRLGFSENQNYPRIVEDNEKRYVNYAGFSDISRALRNIEYSEIYNFLDESNQFNIKLIDGALIHLLYTFNRRGDFIKQRLCYFPAPNYESFQNEPELYLDESNIYADVISKSILPVPVRIDFAPEDSEDGVHPVAHMTLGQYKNCRIPVSSPLCPVTFMKFVLSSFYNTAFYEFNFEMQGFIYPSTIKEVERRMLHVSIE